MEQIRAGCTATLLTDRTEEEEGEGEGEGQVSGPTKGGCTVMLLADPMEEEEEVTRPTKGEAVPQPL